MEKLVLRKDAMLDQIVQALEEGEQLLQDLVAILLRFQDETRVQVLFTGNLSLAEFIDKASVIPFSDAKGLKFTVDQLRDVETFIAWTLKELYKVCDGRLGSGARV